VTDLPLPARPIAPPAEATVNSHLRPHAAENAKRLAPSTLADQDAAEGWEAFQRGDLTSAFVRFGAAASRPDAHVWVYYTLGISAYALTRYRDASDAWERVREAAAGFEPVYFDLIDAYLQERELDRAVQVARAAIDRWPQDAEPYQALGVVQTVRGSLDDAVKSFQSALSLAPSDPNTYFNVAKVMELRYFKSRRYVDQLRRWVSNEKDRSAAIENYRRHVELHGMYADAANAGLRRLEWMPIQKQ
jgi:tetratricopeptide (TPR) repeat protein